MLNSGFGLGFVFTARDLASPVFLRLGQNFGELEEQADRASRKVKSAYERMGEGLGALAGGAAIVGGLAVVGTMAYRTAAQFEQYTIAFETMLGSQEKAAWLLGELRQFAQRTPFDVMGLVEGSKLLMAYGFQLEQILPMLERIGDASAALGTGEDGIQRMIRALGQMQAKGRVLTQELLQLQELGLPVFEILQEELGLTSQQVADIGNYNVAAVDAIEAILRGIEKRFGGLMERQSKSAAGMVANIQDSFLNMRLRVGEGFLDAIKEILRDIKETMDFLDESGALQGMADGFRQLFGVIRPIAGAILSITRRIGELFAQRPELLATITTFAGMAGAVMLVVGSISFLRGGVHAVNMVLQNLGLSGVTSLGGLIGPIAALTAAVFLLTLAYQQNFMGLRELVDKAKLVWQGFTALVSSARWDPRGFIGNLPEELKEALERAGLLDFTLRLFQLFTRLRAFAIAVGQGVALAFSHIRVYVEPVIAVVSWLVGGIVQLLGWLGILVGTTPSSNAWRTFGTALGYVVGLFVAVGGAIFMVTKAWSALSAVMTIARAGFLLLTNPLGLFIAGLTALVAAILWVTQHWDRIREKVAGFVGALVGAVDWLRQIGKALVEGALQIGRNFLNALVQGLRGAAQAVLSALGPVGKIIAGWLGLDEATIDRAAPVVPDMVAPQLVPAAPGVGAVPIDWMASSAVQGQVVASGAAAPVREVVVQPAGGESETRTRIQQPIQLVIDGRVIAETVAEIEDEDRRRAVRW